MWESITSDVFDADMAKNDYRSGRWETLFELVSRTHTLHWDFKS